MQGGGGGGGGLPPLDIQSPQQSTAVGGWWGLAVGSWWGLAVGGWWGLAVGGWWELAVGGWWGLAVGGWWGLAVGGWWGLAVGNWRLAIPGGGVSLRAALNRKKKNWVLKASPVGLWYILLLWAGSRHRDSGPLGRRKGPGPGAVPAGAAPPPQRPRRAGTPLVALHDVFESLRDREGQVLARASDVWHALRRRRTRARARVRAQAWGPA